MGLCDGRWGILQASVGLMVLGAVVAGANDVSFDAHGYLLVFASNCATVRPRPRSFNPRTSRQGTDIPLL